VRRLALSLAFCLVLGLSVALKLPGLLRVTEGSANAISPEIEMLLRQHSFQVSQYAPDNDLTWMSGIEGDCRIMIAAVAPQGWHRALVAQVATGKQLFYLFDGSVYTEQPIFRTRSYHYWRKLNHYIGLSPQNLPVLAIVIAPSCQKVPLSQLAAISTK
jgi:hypothetical protein